MSDAMFHLFVYGTLRKNGSAAHMMSGCEHLGSATVGGVLYDIDGEFPALVLYGKAPVRGEVWRCPSRMLPELDRYERVSSELFRRVAVTAKLETGDSAACWVYVAGPGLAPKLTPERHVNGWPPIPERIPHGS